MQGSPEIRYYNRRTRVNIQSPLKMMLWEFVFLLAKIYHCKTMPCIIMPCIYLKGILVTSNSVLKILQSHISVNKDKIHMQIIKCLYYKYYIVIYIQSIMSYNQIHTHDHKECEHRRILSLTALLVESFLERFHGLSACYSNFPLHTWHIWSENINCRKENKYS